MANEFRMPSLGADMEAGTVVEWRVKPGDAVHRGDVVLEVETEKGLIEVEIWEDGVVESILVDVGKEVPVGTPLALIRPLEGATTPPPTPPAPAPAQAATPAPAPAAPSAPPPTRVAGTGAERQRVSPRARRRAAELRIDLTAVHGTGEGGAITEADVQTATRARPTASGTAAAPAVAPTAEQQAAMRRAIGAAMARAKREIPHYYLDTTIDMSRALSWLTEQNLARPVTSRLLYAALLIKAVALAGREVPEMNGFFAEGGFRPASAIHVGMAIALRGGGLVAPAIRDADRRNLDDLMSAFRDMVQRARAGSLRSSEISDATITITSLGETGVERVFGIIYPPQVALVGFGAIMEQPCADRGAVSIRPVMVASLAADHRVSDGHRGARFLTIINRLLQTPEQL